MNFALLPYTMCMNCVRQFVAANSATSIGYHSRFRRSFLGAEMSETECRNAIFARNLAVDSAMPETTQSWIVAVAPLPVPGSTPDP